MKRRRRLPVEVVAVAGLGSVGFAGLGAAGLVAGGIAGLALALLVLRLDVVAAPRRPRPPRPTPHVNAGFPSYRATVSAVAWAAHSARHRDRILRPLLSEVAAARLAERHGVNLVSDPERARELLGAQLWFLVDPDRAPAVESRGGGLAVSDLDLAVSRLEQL